MRKEEIRTQICECLWKISLLPALSSENIPERMMEYWGVNIDEVCTAKILKRLKKLEKNMDDIVRTHEEEGHEDPLTFGYANQSDEKILEILKGDR